jgi:AraC-like DNA-binding protein
VSGPPTVAVEPPAPAQRSTDRAAQLFRFDERGSDSPYVQQVWRTRSEPVETFLSVADSHWEMVVTRQRGKTSLTVRGPETRASIAPIPQDAEFFGIRFRHGAYMPCLPVGQLVDGSLTLPEATGRSFWLYGSTWEYPTYEDADVFLRRLTRQGLLVGDPIVEDALQGHAPDRSVRTVQRRVVQATGLTQGTIRQIERAQQAVELLDRGVPMADVVVLAGYADQAHLTRSLRRFVGKTPGQFVPALRSG